MFNCSKRKAGALTCAVLIAAAALVGCAFREPDKAPAPTSSAAIYAPREGSGAEKIVISLPVPLLDVYVYADDVPRAFASPEPEPAGVSWKGPLPYVPVAIPEAEYKPEDSGPSPQDEAEQKSMTFLGRFDIVGYDTCVKCSGNNSGITKSGTVATVGRTVAVNGLPFGTRLYIDGIGERVVEDRGYLADGVIDVLCNNHAECYAITGVYDVYIVEETE